MLKKLVLYITMAVILNVAPPPGRAQEAASNLGQQVKTLATGGGCDANVFNKRGLFQWSGEWFTPRVETAAALFNDGRPIKVWQQAV